jgi:hypothetical protein
MPRRIGLSRRLFIRVGGEAVWRRGSAVAGRRFVVRVSRRAVIRLDHEVPAVIV